MESLPQTLSNAIDRELASLHPDHLRQWCFELSQRYRQGLFMETQEHRLGYVAARLPATFGAQHQVFKRISDHLDNATSLLDLGAGAGSLAWAAADVMPKLNRITMVERDVEMVRLGQQLTGDHLAPLELAWCRDDLTKAETFPSHDVVTMSYVLNELPKVEQLKLLDKAFSSADQFLVIIEPGTPHGFGHILTAREHLLSMGANIIAPCTHNLVCPLAEDYKEGKDWCHFSVRIPRGKYHRRAKAGTLPYEDEKYCYLVVSLADHEKPYSRIIREPIRKTGHVILDLCNENGLERDTVAKSDGAVYKLSRNAEWGDPWE